MKHKVHQHLIQKVEPARASAEVEQEQLELEGVSTTPPTFQLLKSDTAEEKEEEKQVQKEEHTSLEYNNSTAHENNIEPILEHQDASFLAHTTLQKMSMQMQDSSQISEKDQGEHEEGMESHENYMLASSALPPMDNNEENNSSNNSADSQENEDLNQSSGVSNGLPDDLRASMESLSDENLEDVKVHNNSSEPAKMGALAYAQGSNIFLGPGQEQHLPHEAWHVVQQKQGRVQPTKQLKGGSKINDDPGLEKEADVMGAKATQMTPPSASSKATEGIDSDKQSVQLKQSISQMKSHGSGCDCEGCSGGTKQLKGEKCEDEETKQGKFASVAQLEGHEDGCDCEGCSGRTSQLKSISSSNGDTVQRQTERSQAYQDLDEELDSTFNVDEQRVLSLMRDLTSIEKVLVAYSSSFRTRSGDALSISETIEAVGILDPTLQTKLKWIESADGAFDSLDYSDIQAMVQAAPQHQRNALKSNRWRDFFVGVCTNSTMITALDDLKFDLITKLRWLRAEIGSATVELSYSSFQHWITSASQEERNLLLTEEWKSFFVEVCSDIWMFVALQDLKFGLDDKIRWMYAENNSFSHFFLLGFVNAATPEEREVVKTEAWRDWFIGFCNDVQFMSLLKALNFDLKTSIDWALKKKDIQYAKQIIDHNPQTKRDEVWQDETYMATKKSELSADTHNDYLWMLVFLRIKMDGSNTQTSAVDADTAIRTHLSAYVSGAGEAVELGRQIEGMVGLVKGDNWRTAGIHRYGEEVWATKNLNGFVDVEGRVWINPNNGNLGTMIHEAMHKYSAGTTSSAISQPMNEGITEYFTRKVLVAESISLSVRGSIYANNKRVCDKLVALTSENYVAQAYFNGANDALEDKFIEEKSEDDWNTLRSTTRAKNWSDALAIFDD